MLSFIIQRLLKKDPEMVVTRMIQRLVRKVRYDYDLYLKLDILSESDYANLLSTRDGKGYLVSVKEEFENKKELVDEFFKLVNQRLTLLGKLYVVAITLVSLVALLDIRTLILLPILVYCFNELTRSLFFKNIQTGQESEYVRKIVSGIKIKHAHLLKVSTLQPKELQTVLSQLPHPVKEIAAVLLAEGSYPTVGEVVNCAEKLAYN